MNQREFNEVIIQQTDHCKSMLMTMKNYQKMISAGVDNDSQPDTAHRRE